MVTKEYSESQMKAYDKWMVTAVTTSRAFAWIAKNIDKIPDHVVVVADGEVVSVDFPIMRPNGPEIQKMNDLFRGKTVHKITRNGGNRRYEFIFEDEELGILIKWSMWDECQLMGDKTETVFIE